MPSPFNTSDDILKAFNTRQQFFFLFGREFKVDDCTNTFAINYARHACEDIISDAIFTLNEKIRKSIWRILTKGRRLQI